MHEWRFRPRFCTCISFSHSLSLSLSLSLCLSISLDLFLYLSHTQTKTILSHFFHIYFHEHFHVMKQIVYIHLFNYRKSILFNICFQRTTEAQCQPHGTIHMKSNLNEIHNPHSNTNAHGTVYMLDYLFTMIRGEGVQW